MQKITVYKKYRYVGTEHTMIRTEERAGKIKVLHGETFTTTMDKSFFPRRIFEYLGETIEKEDNVKEMEDVLGVRTIEKPKEEKKEESTGKKKAQELYVAKFGKKPFPGRDEATILSKLS